MNITILDNREIIIKTSDTFGTQNENKATVFNFSFPESLINANKKIAFITDDGVYWDLITDNSYKITNAVTKYKTVLAYVWLVDVEKNIDFRSKSWKITFNKNEEPDDVVPTEEEISGFDTMIAQLNTAIAEVDNIDIDAEKVEDTATVTITNKQGIQKSVEIKDGSDYIITEDDYREIANIVEADLPENYYNKTETNNLLDGKVDKETGKSLIETTKIEKLDGIETGAEVNIVEDIKVNGTSLEVEEKSVNIPVPTELKDLTDDSTHRTVTDTEKTTWNNKADISDIPDVSGFITKDVNNLTNYTLKTATGSLIDLEINSSNYVVSLSLKDIDGNVISTDNIDLPLESVVVGGSYDAINKKIVLTLENGNTVDIPVGDLIAGLQTEITSQNKLASDLVDDSNSGNKFVNTSEKQAWNAKYDKPAGGIPKTDLASGVGASLDKADSAIQEADLADYVKNTDYANFQKGGTVLANNKYKFIVGNDGLPYADVVQYSDYNYTYNYAFISKGTLENVITGKNLETANNKVTEIDENSTDTEYPSAKLLYDELAEKQEQIDGLVTENALLKDQIPNGTVEGTNAQITDSSNLPIEDGRLEGNTSQETTTGKNLLNIPSNYSFTATVNFKSILEGIGAGDFKISCGKVTKGSTNNPVLAVNNTVITLSSNSETNLTIPATIDSAYLYANGYNYSDSQGVTDVIENLMISTSGGEYEKYTGGQSSPNPSYPQDIHVVTGENSVKVANLNLWDEEWEIGGINNDTGTLETVNNFIRTKNYIKIASSTTYYRTLSTESTRIFYYDSNYNYISNVAVEATGGTFTTSNNAKYLLFKQYGNTYNNDIAIIKGSTGTYTPHAEQNYPVNLGSIELCKIDDYQDYLYRENGNWYKHNTIKKYIFDGSENWIPVNNSENARNVGLFTTFKLQDIKSYPSSVSIIPAMCSDQYISKPNYYYADYSRTRADFTISTINGNVFYLQNGNFSYYTNEQVKNAMIGTILYYPLATPTTTLITDETLVSQLEAYYNSSTYRNVTNIITAGEDLAPIAGIVYKKDLTTLFNKLDSLEARVDLLE